jgi:hypothetical protein
MRMTWNVYLRRYEITSTYDERETIKRAGGMRWDPAAKVWWTDAKATAALFGTVLDEAAKAELDRPIGHDPDNAPMTDAENAEAESLGPTEEFNRCWDLDFNPLDPRVKREQAEFPFDDYEDDEKEGG